MKGNIPIVNIEEKIGAKVIDWISASTSGQLIITKPEKSNSIVDLIIQKRGDYSDKEISYLTIKQCRKGEKEGFFTSAITEGEIISNESLYVLFIYFDIVTQDILEYAWLVPSAKFFEIAEQSTAGGQEIFKFEVPTDVKDINNYSRFLVTKHNLGEILTDIVEKGSEFVFPEAGLSGIRNINIGELKNFIVEARRNTFAGSAVALDNPRLKGSKELEFQKGDWFYQDIYFSGKDNIIGQETVYWNNKPTWAMGYFGDQLKEKPTEFLKQTLSNLAGMCRLGGSCKNAKKEFQYEDNGQGSLEKFFGEENITMNGNLIYKLNYQGGLIMNPPTS